jgi:hypothetical protein
MKTSISDYERSIVEPAFEALKHAVAMQHECLAVLDRLLLVTGSEAEDFESRLLAHAEEDQRLGDLLSHLGIGVREPLAPMGGDTRTTEEF